MDTPNLKENNREESSEGFVRERIVNKLSPKRTFRKLLAAGVCGIVFGLTAGIALAAIAPKASEWFATEGTSPSITVPKDTQAALPEASGEERSTEETEDISETTEPDTETETTESDSTDISEEELKEWIGAIVDDRFDDYISDVNVLSSLYKGVAQLGKTYHRAIVTIVMRDVNTDWFENEVETSGECFGIIWNEAEDGSLYILSESKMPEENIGIQVVFNDGSRRDAVFCQADGQTGLMVLKVEAEDMDPELRSEIQVLSLGNSYLVSQGQLVLVVGGLAGPVGGVIPALVTNNEDIITYPDTIYRKLYLNCVTTEGTGGFVLSLDGNILGIITTKTSGSVTGMIGISDLKGVLELLANGQQIPYLGILGQTVTSELGKKYGLPSGVYVNEVMPDSPAYRAGIKAGDIIVGINTNDIVSISGMKSIVEGIRPEAEVMVTVKRAGNGEYQQIQFIMMPGKR